ncbi:MAG: Na+/H+ antiporter subunit D [Saprospirales bacterium]|nr:MAG: Na+/H+ antiporter subunit D [Saprospirales bacterium]
MENALLLILMIPLLGGIISLFFWKDIKIQKIIFLLSTGGLFLASINLFLSILDQGVITLQSAGWEAPFGISMVGDYLSSFMILLSSLMGLGVGIYSIGDIDRARMRFGFFPLMNFLLFSVCGAFLSGDIFNLYVWFEIMLISSFVLMALGNTKPQLEGAIKYVTINIIASVFFLAGIGMLYGLTGTLNMADLAIRVGTVSEEGLVTLAAVFFFIAFGVKSAIFPLFSWLPASYHTPPVAVTAIFAALLTKVGVYAFIRFFTLIFNHESLFLDNLLLFAAGTTMFIGVLGAAAQMEFRKILSVHIISQIGYLIMGIAIGTKMALVGTIYFLVHIIIVKSNLFLISGVVKRIKGSFELKKLGGVYAGYPFLAVLFAISAFSLAGFPPFTGFWAKFALVKAGLVQEMFFIVLVALATGFLTLYSMTKIWNEVFWKKEEKKGDEQNSEGKEKPAGLLLMMGPIVALTIISLALGIYAEPVFRFAEMTAEQLLNPDIYINGVLGLER